MCKDLEACRSDPIGFAVKKGWENVEDYGYGDIVGIAKDGHMIYGPYNDKGNFWGCDDHDVCNGAFIEGNYVYLSTKTFPYVLGCFGPGPQQTLAVTCSESSCPNNSNDDGNGAISNAVATISTLIACLFISF